MLDLTKKQKQWLAHHRKHIESGLSQYEYCKQNGLSRGAFLGARNIFEKKGLSARGKNLIPVFSEPQKNNFELQISGTIFFSTLPEPSWLASLIFEIGKISDQPLEI